MRSHRGNGRLNSLHLTRLSSGLGFEGKMERTETICNENIRRAKKKLRL